jgi:hypothetical protein
MQTIELSLSPYLDDLRADLRAFVAFFAPDLVARDVDFFAPVLALDRDFVDFLVVALAICGCPFVPL